MAFNFGKLGPSYSPPSLVLLLTTPPKAPPTPYPLPPILHQSDGKVLYHILKLVNSSSGLNNLLIKKAITVPFLSFHRKIKTTFRF